MHQKEMTQIKKSNKSNKHYTLQRKSVCRESMIIDNASDNLQMYSCQLMKVFLFWQIKEIDPHLKFLSSYYTDSIRYL